MRTLLCANTMGLTCALQRVVVVTLIALVITALTGRSILSVEELKVKFCMSAQSGWKLIAVFVALLVILGVAGTTGQQDRMVVDTHAHLYWEVRSGGSADLAVKTALETMDRLGIRVTLIMPPPFPSDNPQKYDCRKLIEATKKYPGRFAVLGGGGSLNPMIHSVRPDEVTADIRRSFEEAATEILRSGAIGFSETAAEHFSLHTGHPYLSAPPDHPLFLLLADIAADHDVPIDLHMEAVAEDMPLPGKLGPPNPATLHENIAALERLLSHNRNARIVWAHAGWDNTGCRTVELMRQLLQRHPNLYMSIKIQRSLYPQNAPLDDKGRIRPEWLELVRAFPDRFVIGSDTFYGEEGEVRWGTSTGKLPSEDLAWVFLKSLPSDLGRKLAYENVVRIYRLI